MRPLSRMPLDITALESWLWEAACIIRGPVDAPKFKDYILPLIFLKRLSDVFEDEIKRLEQDFGTRTKALKLADTDHKLVRFFVPENSRWTKPWSNSARPRKKWRLPTASWRRCLNALV